MKALLGLVALLAWVIPLQATSAQIETKTEVINLPSNEQTQPNSTSNESDKSTDAKQKSGNADVARVRVVSSQKVQPSGRHSTRAEKQISEEALLLYLQQRNSPLAGFSSQILASPYWSTIIGICTIEQYGCTRAPGNNYWGIMCGGKVCTYQTMELGIAAVSSLLDKMYDRGRTTVESLNGHYVVPASSNWLNTVLKTKLELESLTSNE